MIIPEQTKEDIHKYVDLAKLYSDLGCKRMEKLCIDKIGDLLETLIDRGNDGRH